MASLLRQIVASPRSRHPEANLDLCYVTDNIIATSGPSDTYPKRAYRNPLPTLVTFLDSKHKDKWAIWEFRAEGTGYPDAAVYNRIWHYPWPDHHPPPFKLIPLIMASMRNWIKADGEQGRVIVVHCKAGKGRSGTAACSYLISEEGWKKEDALKRFTERRMKPGWGEGLSIPSQVRWVGYVDRWARNGKVYVERQIEILEVHVWGLRDGVKVAVEGFVDEGRTIKLFHTFKREEREVVKGSIKENTGFADIVQEVMKNNTSNGKNTKPGDKNGKDVAKGEGDEATETSPTEPGGDAVFRPSTRVVLPTNDINIDFERRNKAIAGYTMVTSVAHVWFNAFFEGKGPEKNGEADESGIFEIDFDAMDGIKGSARKGTRAFDKLAVIWKAIPEGLTKEPSHMVIKEPALGEEVPQVPPADWKGRDDVSPSGHGKDLGLRVASPDSRHSSRASSTHEEASSKAAQNLVSVGTEEGNEGTKTHGPEGEEQIHLPRGPLPTSSELLYQRTHEFAAEGDLPQYGVAEVLPAEEAHKLAQATKLAHSEAPKLAHPDPGKIHAKPHPHLSTADLPDGKPEEQMKEPNEHMLGAMKKKNDPNIS